MKLLLQKLSWILGIFSLLFYFLNLVFWSCILFITAIFCLIIPNTHWRKLCTNFMQRLPIFWMDCNQKIIKILIPTQWKIEGLNNVRIDDWYLVLANHQSWLDIVVLQNIFNRKIPTLKFFMKKELLWSLPFASWACWLLDFPFMERHTKNDIAKNPELKGKDIATARLACEKFKTTPTTVTIFPEGTRFNLEKRQRQRAPYQNLLKPKAGGIAFALAVLGDHFHTILDVTINYSKPNATLWDFFCGKIETINVYIKPIAITEKLLGDYENNRDYRKDFQQWLNQLWQDKDTFIAKLGRMKEL